MEFRILGPIELWAGGRRYDLGTAKERCVLAVLLLNPGRPISPEKLIGYAWDDNPPVRARDSLYTYVSRLRRRLQEIGGAASIASSRSGGYVFEGDEEAVDLHRFRLLRRQAKAIAESGDTERALTLHREAALLRRAEPLAGLSGAWAERTRVILERELLAGMLERIEMELRLGRHADLVTELTELSSQDPFNEKLVEYLMLALYHSGRPAEALRAYHEASHRLHTEAGIEISPNLQELQRRMLEGDPALSRTISNESADLPPHDNLPVDLRLFTGREGEINRLLALTSSTRPEASPTVVVIDGMPGIGKTVFAVHLARRLSDRFPDGRLYLNLHAYDAERAAIQPSEALDTLLRMIGVPSGRIPPEPDDRAALWRLELSRRRILLVLDDAAGPDQVRPLLPGDSVSLTLVTSRRRLAGLDDIHSCSLDVMSPREAAALLERVVGPGRSEDAEDIAKVVRLCGHLPMAIQLVGNRLRHRPAWTAADLADRLTRHDRRLPEIRAGDRKISAAFDLSYRGLTAHQQKAFRRLSLHVGSDLTRYSAAAALGGSLAEADRILDDLLDHHLITEPIADRFRFHDLIRDYARHLAERDDSETARRETVRRIIEYYLRVAAHADHLLDPHRRRLRLDLAVPTPDIDPVDTVDQAREWMRAELQNLLSAVDHAFGHGWQKRAALLAHVLASYLENGGHWDKAGTLHERAIDAWRTEGYPTGLAQALSDLSLVRFRSGRYREALTYAEEALAIFRSAADKRGEADVLDQMSLIHWHQSRFTEALSCSRQVLRIRRALGDRRGEARALDHIAIFLEFVGRFRDALEHRRRSLAIFATIDDAPGLQMALNNMGDLQLRLGDVAAARDYYERAAEVDSEMGRQHGAIWLSNMANVHLHAGRNMEALDGFRKALPTYQEIGDRRNEIEILLGIGTVFGRMGRHGEAVIHFQKALALSREIAERYEEARTVRCLGDVLSASGRYEAALERYYEALAIADQIGVPFEKAKCLEGIGTVLAHTRGRGHAKRFWKRALRIHDRLGVPDGHAVRTFLSGPDEAAGS